ncbi:MAG: YggS family pyridoxal phosphate-dependent enzyme [Cuneatibacter sp.]|nr:YggS family pyridoxal phosphate-dependent enzyme [Cuneatibacter sp.]
MSVAEQLEHVRGEIRLACGRSGRNPEEVTLIAVSKTKPESMLEEAIAAGQDVFGENKVQEMKRKANNLPKNLHWHMIGHLQTNKVRDAVAYAELIHSVDSLHLAEKIEEEAAKQDKKIPILLEVNVAEEESKFGLSMSEVEPLLRQIAAFPHIQVEGLMTIAPYCDNPEDNRSVFRKLHELFIDMKEKSIDNINMTVLSMGMTGDYTVAVEEGATMVRVGTGIFGVRNYMV